MMGSMIEAMNKRTSVRTYSDKPVEIEKQDKIRELIRSNTQGPFGNHIRFELINLNEMETRQIRELGTYGFIQGARMYIATAVHEAAGSMEDLGYCFETIILGITNLGLGTCWMGGTFKRAGFAKKINIASDEICPAVSPVGYAHEKRSLRDRSIRRMAKSDKRKPWEELFFEGNLETNLSKEAAGAFATPLECLRIGPSASNNQPWRIVKESGADIFHFLLKRTRGYDKAFKGVDLQLMDIGIAMCHFELAARETGLSGQWKAVTLPDVGNAVYITSWVAGEHQQAQISS